MGRLVSIGFIGLILGGLRVVGAKRGAPSGSGGQTLTFEIADRTEFENLLLGLRSYHYRARRRAVTTLREFYYDTRDWKLAQQSYSCRLVERIGDDGKADHSIELTRFSPGPEGFDAVDELGDSDRQLAAEALWERALSAPRAPPAIARLRSVLRDLGIEEGSLGIRGIGDATIEHYDVTDKGRKWFDLDYERWSFSAPGGESAVAFQWHGIALSPNADPPDDEFRARVEQLEKVLPTFYRLRTEEEPRLALAIQALRQL